MFVNGVRIGMLAIVVKHKPIRSSHLVLDVQFEAVTMAALPGHVESLIVTKTVILRKRGVTAGCVLLYHHQAYEFCPDSNHPHIIDLGLPSEVKWSSCNVDASKPEDYGVTIPFSTYFTFAKDFVPLHPQNTSNYV